MLITKNYYGYSRKKKYLTGRGFIDSLSNVFNSALRSIGSYISTNKDLIAKPLLGAVGSLAATGLTAGVPALIRHIARGRTESKVTVDDPKYKELLQSLAPSAVQSLQHTPVTNIIGSGVRKNVRRYESGIKTF